MTNRGTWWTTDDMEVENGRDIIRGKLCKVFRFSFTLTVLFLHGSDGTRLIYRIRRTMKAEKPRYLGKEAFKERWDAWEWDKSRIRTGWKPLGESSQDKIQQQSNFRRWTSDSKCCQDSHQPVGWDQEQEPEIKRRLVRAFLTPKSSETTKITYEQCPPKNPTAVSPCS